MENTYQLFDDYLNNTLFEDQINEFEKRLETDPYFRKEFEAHKLVLGAIYGQKDKELLSELAMEKVRVLKTWHYMSIAASILILAVFVFKNPFNQEEVLLTEGNGQKISYMVTSEALAFTSTTDSLVLQLNHIKGKDRYEFGDTLKLFLTIYPVEINVSLKYYEDSNKYEITIDEKKYFLKSNKTGFLK